MSSLEEIAEALMYVVGIIACALFIVLFGFLVFSFFKECVF
jgi:hypothetical protein